jgi:hypothetical protein
VEDRKSQNIVVDNDLPVADVLLPLSGTYLPGDAQIVITATDPTSGIAGAALSFGLPVEPAPLCENKATGWCPTFKAYHGEGDYGLLAEATDLVGHTFSEDHNHFVIVDTHPPTVTFGFTAGQRLDAMPDPAHANGWLVHLWGETGDPRVDLGYGSPGSGVPADGVRVTVYDANGGLAGQRRMVAALSGHAWSLDYPLTDSHPNGCYKVEVESSGALAGLPGLDDATIAQHRAITNRTVGISAAAPSPQLDQAWLSAHSIISSTAPLGGVATSRPVAVKLAWTTGDGGSKAAVSLACSAPGSHPTYTPLSVPAGKFAAGTSYSWGGEIQRGATCQAVVTAPAASKGVLSGTISVCGAQVATWSDNGADSQTVSFTASSDACAADTCSGGVATAGVGGVDVAYTSILPQSAFVDFEGAIPPNERLHLPFEESETPFLDASGNAHHAACSGSSCPTTGQAGKYGSALRFDGLNDTVSVPHYATLNPIIGTDFTIAAWVKPDATQPTLTSAENCLVEKYSGSYSCPYSINYINQKGGADAGKIKIGRWSYPGPGVFMKSTATVNDGNFHHVAFVGRA